MGSTRFTRWYRRNFWDEYDRFNTGRLGQICAIVMLFCFTILFSTVLIFITWQFVWHGGKIEISWENVKTLAAIGALVVGSIFMPMLAYRMKKTNGKAHNEGLVSRADEDNRG